MNNQQISYKKINQKIYVFRALKVMLDFDLAQLYEVPTKEMNLSIKRNIERFPADFRFRLTKEEFECLPVITGRGGRRYLPHVFTEQGIAMLSSVLNSSKAVEINILIMRAFVVLRENQITNETLALKLRELESKYDQQFKMIFDVIRDSLIPEEKNKRKIGLKN